jgi:hypothetical protein
MAAAMHECLLALSLFAFLALTATLVHALNWFDLLRLGVFLLAAGTLASCTTGAIYHLMLARTQACRRNVVPRWWWSPTRLHPALLPAERRRVMPWFYAGACSFCLVVLGALWALLAVWHAQP